MSHINYNTNSINASAGQPAHPTNTMYAFRYWNSVFTENSSNLSATDPGEYLKIDLGTPLVANAIRLKSVTEYKEPVISMTDYNQGGYEVTVSSEATNVARPGYLAFNNLTTPIADRWIAGKPKYDVVSGSYVASARLSTDYPGTTGNIFVSQKFGTAADLPANFGHFTNGSGNHTISYWAYNPSDNDVILATTEISVGYLQFQKITLAGEDKSLTSAYKAFSTSATLSSQQELIDIFDGANFYTTNENWFTKGTDFNDYVTNPATADGEYLMIKLPDKRKLVAYKLTREDGTFYQFSPQDFTLYARESSTSDWVNLTSESLTTSTIIGNYTTGGGTRYPSTGDLTPTTAYQYFALVVTSIWENNHETFALSEFELFCQPSEIDEFKLYGSIVSSAPIPPFVSEPQIKLTSNSGVRGYSCSASSVNGASTTSQPYEPFMAFDGYTSPTANFWGSTVGVYDASGNYNGDKTLYTTSGAVSGEYIILNMPHTLRLTAVKLAGQYTTSPPLTNAPKNWSVYGKNTGSWELIQNFTNSVPGTDFSTYTLTTPSTIEYQSFAILISTTNGNNNVAISEIEFYGSMNNFIWTEILHETSVPAITSTGTEFTITNENAYQHYGLVVTKTRGHHNVSIGEMKILENTDITVSLGGTIITDGDYKVHVFTSSGTFEIVNGGSDIDFLVVGGGGAGGCDPGGGWGGGGGAGGYRTSYGTISGGGSAVFSGTPPGTITFHTTGGWLGYYYWNKKTGATDTTVRYQLYTSNNNSLLADNYGATFTINTNNELELDVNDSIGGSLTPTQFKINGGALTAGPHVVAPGDDIELLSSTEFVEAHFTVPSELAIKSSVESKLQLSAGTYNVVVGAGGITSNTAPTNGEDSSFAGITSLGGGYGGILTSGYQTGGTGGSGGGSYRGYAGGSGTSNQGFDGAAGVDGGRSGGGGGAGSPGSEGDGGDGLANAITGTITYYAGGGGQGYRVDDASVLGSGIGGLGGGGDGVYGSNGNDGVANTGGGGGGLRDGAGYVAGNGGSGIVVIRYKFQ